MTTMRLYRLVCDLSPSQFSQETILMWISQAEQMLACDVLEIEPELVPEITELSQAPMIVPHPYDRVYLPYVQAMIANAQGETDLYQNYIAEYNAFRDDWAQWVLNGRERESKWYVSAYKLACEQGYQGSLDQWLESLHGEKGEKGDGVIILGHYDSLEELQRERPIGRTGDYYEVGTSPDNAVVYYWDNDSQKWQGIDIVDGQRKAREWAERADAAAERAGESAAHAARAAEEALQTEGRANLAAERAGESAAHAARAAEEALQAEGRTKLAEQSASNAAERAEAAAEEALAASLADVSTGYAEAHAEDQSLTPERYMMSLTDGLYRISDNNGASVYIGRTVTAGGIEYLSVDTYYGGVEHVHAVYIDGVKAYSVYANSQDQPVDISPAAVVADIADIKERMAVLEDIQHPTSWEDVHRIVSAGLANRYFEIGDQLQCKKAGDVLTWDVIDINAEIDADGNQMRSITLQLHNLLPSTYEFDAPEIDNPDPDRAGHGSNSWEESGIRQWLNSQQEAFYWFEKQGLFDDAPSYINQPGFLNGVDPEFVAHLGSAQKKTGRVETVDKVWLPSRAEIFSAVASGEKAYQYYRDGRQASQASTEDDPIRIKTLQGATTGQIWLTRNASGTRTVYVVSATGSSYNDYTERKRRIAPCVCIV